MKKQTKVISALLAIIMALSTMTLGVSAVYSDYSSPAGYDSLGKPFISLNQCGSILCDYLDETLAGTEISGSFDPIFWSKIDYDLTSINGLLNTIEEVWGSGLLRDAKKLIDIGDLDDLNISKIKTCPRRSTKANGHYDIEIIYALVDFIGDNGRDVLDSSGNFRKYGLLVKILNGTIDLGTLDKLDWISAIEDILNLVRNLPIYLKQMIWDGLFPTISPSGLVEPDAEKQVAGATIEEMINRYVYNLLFQTTSFDNEPQEPLLPGIKSYLAPKMGVSTLSESKFKLEKLKVYDLFRAARDYAIDEYLINADATEDEFSLYNTLLDVDPTYLSIAYSFLEFDTTPYATNEETVRAFTNSLLDFENGVLSPYITITDDAITIQPKFTELFNKLLELASGFVSELNTFPNIHVLSDAELAEYKKTASTPELVAYMLRVALNGFVDWCDIPTTYVCGGETRTVTTFPEIATFVLLDTAQDFIPETDYGAMIERGEIDPLVYDYENSKVDSAALTIGAGVMRYFLNIVTTMNIPAGLDFAQTLNYIVDWAVGLYGGVLNTSAFNKYYTAWDKLDYVLFGIRSTYNSSGVKTGTSDVATAGILKTNWLKNVTGSYDLIFNHIITPVFELDFAKLFSLFQVNTAGELNKDCRTLILNVARRILNGLVGGNSVIPQSVTTLESIFTNSTMASMVRAIATYLPRYDEAILASVLPLIASSLADDAVDNYSVHLKTTAKPYPTYNDLVSAYEAYGKPHNGSLKYYEEGYGFFGAEDFAPAYRYYDFKEARKDAEKVIKKYAQKAADKSYTFTTQEAYAIGDAHYVLTHYYNLLALRTKFDTTQLEIDMEHYESIYGHALYGRSDISNQYTQRTWTNYIRAYDFCERVYETALFNLSDSLRQSMITEARHELRIAVKSLKDYVPLANYGALNNLIVLAQNRLKDKDVLDGEYIESSVATLRNALRNAQSVVNEYYDVDDQSIVDGAFDALNQAMTLIYKSTIAKVKGTTTNVDKVTKFITGLVPGFTSYAGQIEVRGSGKMVETTNTAGGIGTGAKVELVVNDESIDAYNILIYGDVDGDTYVDGTDANILNFYVNDYLGFSTATPEKQAVRMSADVNHDGSIDINDVYYLIRVGLLDSNYVVDQLGTEA